MHSELSTDSRTKPSTLTMNSELSTDSHTKPSTLTMSFEISTDSHTKPSTLTINFVRDGPQTAELWLGSLAWGRGLVETPLAVLTAGRFAQKWGAQDVPTEAEMLSDVGRAAAIEQWPLTCPLTSYLPSPRSVNARGVRSHGCSNGRADKPTLW